MAKVTITGASDDLIEIDGDIREEFCECITDGEKRYLAFSDGTVLSVKYDDDGIWRFNFVSEGTAMRQKVEGIVENDTFDVITLEGNIKWVVYGSEYAKGK